MSDCAAAPSIFIPPWGEASKGVRAMVMAIRLWADARGSIDCTEAELAAMTGYELKAVERHMKEAVRLQLVSRSERRRGSDGRLSGYRYWLSAKLNGPWVHPTNCRVEDGAAAPVGNAVDEPPDNLSEATRQSVPGEGAATRHPVPGADKLSGGEGPENNGLEALPRERARAFPFSSSSFLSFPWRDEAVRVKAGELLSVCGPKLGDIEKSGERVLHSLAYVLETGLWAEFDWTLDVLPVATVKTGPTQTRVLWDLALITSNIAKHRKLRLGIEAAPKATGAPGGKSRRKVFDPPVLPDDERRARRIDALRREIAAIDRGEGQPFMLPNKDRSLSSEWLADAYAAVRKRDADELARLEADAAGAASAKEGV